jgi:hypothetical protein
VHETEWLGPTNDFAKVAAQFDGVNVVTRAEHLAN